MIESCVLVECNSENALMLVGLRQRGTLDSRSIENRCWSCQTIISRFISVEFSGSTGLMRSVTLTETKDDGSKPEVTKVNVNLEFVKYGTVNKKVGFVNCICLIRFAYCCGVWNEKLRKKMKDQSRMFDSFRIKAGPTSFSPTGQRNP